MSRGDALLATETYAHLVRDHRLVPGHFFPFAVDGGGDYFFVDCSTTDGEVHLYRHDTARAPLIPLSIGLNQFWDRLQPQ